MEIEFIEEKENKVALLNTKKELIVVDNVQPHYGEPKALGYAKVYDTVDDLEYIEAQHVIAKNEEPEEEPAEEEAEEMETKLKEKTQFVLVVVKVYSWLTMVTGLHVVNVDTLK